MSRAAQAVFVLLVGATFAAFFLAQSLKSSPTLLSVRGEAQFFSPNGDGTKDVNDFSVTLTRRDKPDDVTVHVLDEDGDEVRLVAGNVAAVPFRPLRLSWNGRTDDGAVAPDGFYRLRISLRRQNRAVTLRRRIELDTTAPTPRVDLPEDQPHVIGPEGSPVRFTLRGAEPHRGRQIRVWRTDVEPALQVGGLTLARGVNEGEWDGTVDGEPAPRGTYLIEAVASDRAANRGSSAPGLPGGPVDVRGRGGVTVRRLAVAPPLRPTLEGARATFFVDARGRRYRWRVRRIGEREFVKNGRGKGPQLRVRAPKGPSGVYLLEVGTGGDTVRVPFAVQSEERNPILVVLPAITWLGYDEVDDDGDGLADTLIDGSAVPREGRVLVGRGGLPVHFAAQVAPLLVYLDRIGLEYDLTTDIALADSRDPRATDRTGVLLPSALRWVPRPLARRLREYVQSGGRLAAFGTETLRRGVDLGPNRLTRPTQPTPDDPFGARLTEVRELDAPVTLTPLPGTRSGNPLLTGWGGVLEGFSVLEESQLPESDDEGQVVGLGQGLSEEEIAEAEAAGDPPREARPALTSTELGEGLVIRVGLPEWASRLDDDGVEQITRNLLDLLRRKTPKPRSPTR